MEIQSKFCLLVMLAYFLGITQVVQAQGGCPATVIPANATQLQVIEVIQIAPAVPETSFSQAQGAFYQNRINVTFGPNQRAILSSTPDGHGNLCSDDWAELRTFPSGQVYNHDFRNAAISQTLPIAPVDVTYLFVPGENDVTLNLIDLTAPAYSSSPYYLVIVNAPATPTPVPTATFTPRPTNTPSPTTLPTSTPTATATPTITVSVLFTPPSAPDQEAPQTWPNLPWGWLGLVGLGLLMLAVLGVFWRQQHKQPPPGQVVIYEGERYVQTVKLAKYGKPVVQIGGQNGDVVLAGVPLAARISAQREPKGRRAVIEIVDPTTQEVLEKHKLEHEDVHYLGEFTLVYQRYQVEKSFLEGALSNA